MDYLATVVLSFLIIGAVVFVLSRVRVPRYRLRRENVIELLKMTLAGSASANDWHVFASLPIRHDPELEAVRQRCLAIEEKNFIGNSTGWRNGRRLFTAEGLQAIEQILHELEADTESIQAKKGE